jgi:hypothetical protein
MSSGEITAFVVDPDLRWRARYAFYDESADGGVRFDRYDVVGWAACDREVWPVRIEPDTGRGVLVGSSGDPHRAALLIVGTHAAGWKQAPGVDERIRAIIRAGVEGED